ncbi:MAG: hypothetical protein NTV56_20500 [Alphaproteobacteria bacterium]|nr:hypothetical protein [Alphaproteobacteria bacterium]
MTAVVKSAEKTSKTAKSSKTERAQADIVARLRRTDLPRAKYKGLAKCGVQGCGMKRCRDVCAYGSERRLERQAAAARKLLKKVGGPHFEVHVGRQTWQRPVGDLDKVSLAAAKQVERNALDKLHMPGIAAVGMVKTAYMPDGKENRWHVEIHQVIAGASREEIFTAFATRPTKNNGENYFRIDEIKDLKPAVRRVLNQVVIVQQRPDDGDEPAWPKTKARREYYRWALSLRNGERVIRYGCDQHFNRIKKVGRTIKPKPPRKHNAPWLEKYQFGSEYWEHRGDPGDLQGLEKREVVPPPSGYYEIDD